MHYDDFPDPETEKEARPWIVLKSTYDIEAWIEQTNRRLQRLMADAPPRATGQGICFTLAHGGELYTHSSPEGELWLELSEDAAWVRPVIAAIAGSDAAGALWRLPGEALTELLYGLNNLIDTSRLVLQHDFPVKRRY